MRIVWVRIGDSAEIAQIPLEVRSPKVAQPGSPILGAHRLERRVATPHEVILGPSAPDAGLVGGRRSFGHPAHRGLAFLPDAVETGRRRFVALDALDQRERPELQKGGTPGQRLADLLEQQDLGGAEEQKATSFASISEQLHRVEKAGLLLHFIEDDEARAVIEPSHGISRQAQTFLRVVEREVDPCRPTGRRKQVTDQRRLAGLASARENGDRALREPVDEQGHQPARAQDHSLMLSA